MPSTHASCSILFVLVLTLTLPSASIVFADSHAHCQHVRVADARLRARFDIGARRSATLRRLAAELEASDVIVYVMAGDPGRAGTHGGLTFVTSVGSHRFLRVTIDDRLPAPMLVALLAHELQHAVEVAREPGVVDDESFAQLYDRIGVRSCARDAHPCYETEAARLTTGQVLVEMRGDIWSR